MLTVSNLVKSFGTLKAVAGISFEVQPGEIYGLLGRNGAGKTTTISCICGLLKPDSGRTTLSGIDLASDPIAFKRMIGMVPQEIAIYGDLTVSENIRFWGELAGLRGQTLKRNVAEVIDLVALGEKAKSASAKLSGGMKRRLNLAIGMVHKPKLLLLDEPTVGIDVDTRRQILKVVRQVATQGIAVLYTTHYLEEAQDLCQRIGIMEQGEVLAEGTLDDLRRLVGEGQILSLSGGFVADALRGAIGSDPHVRIVSIQDGVAMLDIAERGSVSAVLQRILAQEIPVEGISIQDPSLQGVFLKITGRELTAENAE